MNIATIIGLIGVFAMTVMAVYTSGGSIITYMDLPSFLMTVVGSYFAIFTFTSIAEALGMWKTFGIALGTRTYDAKGIITKLQSFSEKARREGLLSLDEELEDLDDDFLKKGMRLVVDGTDGAIIRDLLENELSQMQGRHSDKIGVINMWGTLAPGLGMLGTVVGLIAMLQNLADKSALGPNMAVALITTLYGAMIANLICIPISGKLKAYDAAETQLRELEIEGILSIQAGDNPRMLASKLLSYLDPKSRHDIEQQIGKD